MKKNIDVSLIIATFNTKSILNNVLTSIYKHTKDINFEIILVDDASTDGSFEYVKKTFPKVIALKNEKNLGYSKTCNLGTKKAKGKYILQMNSDITFTKETCLSELIKFMEHNKKVGIVGCKIIRPDGKLDPPCRHALPNFTNTIFQTLGLYKIFPNFKHGNYYMTYLDDNEITQVGGLGAFMLIRRDVFQDIGYLDEQFFLYCEDTDFCLRAKKAGWELYYYPKISVHHLQGGSTKRFPVRSLWIFHKSIYKFYKKNYAKNNFFLLNIIVYIGIMIRMIFLLITKLIRYTYSNIISYA